MRDLASVVTIKEVIPMLGKDRISCVSFEENGYEAIVPKENAKIGNKLVFIQEGSILPIKPQWEFLRKRCFSEKWEGFVIKPMTMGQKENGQRVKSWGLAVTLKDCGLTENDLKSDLTKLLEIRKCETEENEKPCSIKIPKLVKFCLSKKLLRPFGTWLMEFYKEKKYEFPTSLISKSDETTIQNLPGLLEEHEYDPVYVTAKMEGQSVTALFDYDGKKIGKFYVCSRNIAYKKNNGNTFWKVAVETNLEKKLRKWYKQTGQLLIIQAEQCGPGIQNNIYCLDKLTWYVYTIKDAIIKKQLSYIEMMNICDFLGLKTVPLIRYDVRLKSLMPDMNSAIAYAEKIAWYKDDGYMLNVVVDDDSGYNIWKNCIQHEGIVVRSLNYDKDNGKGFSFKIKNLQYSEKSLENIHSLALSIF